MPKVKTNTMKIWGFVVALIVVSFLVIYYRNVVLLRNGIIGLNSLFKSTTIVFLFYILIIIIFRDKLNIKNLTWKTFGKVSLMSLSAYFSYLAFDKLDVPKFFAMTGGMGFVIGVLEVRNNLKKANVNKRNKIDWSALFYAFATVMAVLLDILMTASNLVLSEGKTAIKQKTFHDYAVIQRSRENIERVQYLKSLTDDGNFNNARFHATNFARLDSISLLSQPKTKIDSVSYFSGPLKTGFVTLTGSEKRGRVITVFFILVVSCAITILMIAFDDDEGDTGTETTKSGRILGFQPAGAKAENENGKIENENKKTETETENMGGKNENFGSNFRQNVKVKGDRKRKELADQVKMKVKQAVDAGYDINAQIAKLKGINLTGQRVGQIRRELGI